MKKNKSVILSSREMAMWLDGKSIEEGFEIEIKENRSYHIELLAGNGNWNWNSNIEDCFIMEIEENE